MPILLCNPDLFDLTMSFFAFQEQLKDVLDKLATSEEERKEVSTHCRKGHCQSLILSDGLFQKSTFCC